MSNFLSTFWTTYSFAIELVLLNVGLTFSMYSMMICGRLSLAPVAYMAIGGYSAAYATTRGAAFILGLSVGVVLSVVLAVVFGLLVMRLRSIYFTVATLGLVLVVSQVSYNLTPFTGGALGVTGIPQLVDWRVLLVFALVTAFIAASLEKTRVGRAWRVIGTDDRIASGIGINPRRYILQASALSAIISSTGGALYAHMIPFIDPSAFGFNEALSLLTFAVLGGSTAWLGPIIGAAIVTSLPEVLRPIGDNRDIFQGAILIAVMIFLPGGLADLASWKSLVANMHRAAISLRQGPPVGAIRKVQTGSSEPGAEKVN